MKTLYFDCSMGAAGDMLTAALLELHPEPNQILHTLNHCGLEGVSISSSPSVKCGIQGTHVSVEINGMIEDEYLHEHEHHHHEHNSLHDLEHRISHLKLPEKVLSDIQAVYRLLAEAEGHVHGMPVEQIHFHEVGTMDALADIAAVCLLIHELQPNQILASPIHVGSGQVRCAHGILPVPAPATAELLRGIPIYSGEIRGELCTPTGAALLKHFVSAFGAMPTMIPDRIGYGMGKKDFPAANCVRAVLGTTEQAAEDLVELRCNLDDMTPEAIAFAAERLFEAGALDVFTCPIGMKKGRPGTLLNVLSKSEDKEQLLQLLFRHTTTLGVREYPIRRHSLSREIVNIPSPYGPIRCKKSSGYGIRRCKYEYEDLARIAKQNNLSLEEALKALPAED